MKITVLDGHALNPGDISWSEVQNLGEFKVYERTPQNLVAERISNSDIILLNKIQITDEILQKCPNLKYIGVLATGYNVVDVNACKNRGIVVTNIPSYSADAVAQQVFAFILNFANRVNEYSEDVKNGGWIKSPDFCYILNPLTELSKKTLGIFGYGSIGKKVAKIASAFGMNVIACTHGGKFTNDNTKNVSIEELFSKSDFLTLHAPLTKETQNVVNEKTISLMKKSSIIVNTARGGLVDEGAVKNALDLEKIAGYACDVLTEEPMSEKCVLLNTKNCLITPHIAWAAKETRERLMKIAVENIKSFLSGKTQNVVN